MEIHQLHIRPADFFTSNPALDMPTRKNESSVLVSCCDKNKDMDKEDGETKSGSVQASALAHQQGNADIDPKDLGKGSSESKRHSTLGKIFSWKKDSKS